MKQISVFLLLFLSLQLTAQKALILDENESTVKKPIEFNHLPFILLKIKPSSMLEFNNTFQYGLELAPPIGKFSFNFDYGTGKGSWNKNKYIRNNQSANKNTEMRGEIRMYFSDWYPFYVLDKKPFGRYYAIEYFNTTYNRDANLAYAIGGTTLPSYAQFMKQNIIEKDQGVNFKFGKHFQLHRYLFIDAFAGLGIGLFKVTSNQNTSNELSTVPLHYSFLSNYSARMPGTKGYFLSKTLGFRLAVPL